MPKPLYSIEIYSIFHQGFLILQNANIFKTTKTFLFSGTLRELDFFTSMIHIWKASSNVVTGALRHKGLNITKWHNKIQMFPQQ